MIPYGYGMDPMGADLLRIDYKQLTRDCKALVKRIGRKIHRKVK